MFDVEPVVEHASVPMEDEVLIDGCRDFDARTVCSRVAFTTVISVKVAKRFDPLLVSKPWGSGPGLVSAVPSTPTAITAETSRATTSAKRPGLEVGAALLCEALSVGLIVCEVLSVV